MIFKKHYLSHFDYSTRLLLPNYDPMNRKAPSLICTKDLVWMMKLPRHFTKCHSNCHWNEWSISVK